MKLSFGHKCVAQVSAYARGYGVTGNLGTRKIESDVLSSSLCAFASLRDNVILTNKQKFVIARRVRSPDESDIRDPHSAIASIQYQGS
jgi:hypothetical protein